MKNKEAIVIGGGPAGCSAAIGLKRAGYQVTILEARAQLMRRVCGSFLSAEAQAHLSWLGVYDELVKLGAVTVTSTTVHVGTGSPFCVGFSTTQGPGLSCDRSTLEDRLLLAAQKAGVEIKTACRVLDLHRDYERDSWIVAYRKIEPTQTQLFSSSNGMAGREAPLTSKVANIAAPFVVIASGRYSVGSYIPQKQQGGWYGWNALFRGVLQKPGEQSLHFFRRGYVGVITYSNGESNVCGLIKRTQGETSWDRNFLELCRQQSSLARLFIDADRLTDWKAVGPLPFSDRMRSSDGPLLVGDAAAVGDPFMGEGLGRALAAGPMLYEASKSTDVFGTYSRLWRARYTRRLEWGRRIRFVLDQPLAYKVVLRPLLSQQWMIRRLTTLFHGSTGLYSIPSRNKGEVNA